MAGAIAGVTRRLLDGAARMVDSTDRSVEMHLVMGCLGVLAFIGLAVYHVVGQGHPFDPSAYGSGLALTFASAGLGAIGQAAQRRIEGQQPAPGGA